MVKTDEFRGGAGSESVDESVAAEDEVDRNFIKNIYI
jgi:hypothetical protein